MTIIGFYAVISYLALKGFSPKEAYEGMVAIRVYSYSVVKRWAAEFLMFSLLESQSLSPHRKPSTRSMTWQIDD